jgi:hypothetical protein
VVVLTCLFEVLEFQLELLPLRRTVVLPFRLELVLTGVHVVLAGLEEVRRECLVVVLAFRLELMLVLAAARQTCQSTATLAVAVLAVRLEGFFVSYIGRPTNLRVTCGL